MPGRERRQDAQASYFFLSLARVSCEQMQWAARVCLGPCWVGRRVRDYIVFGVFSSPFFCFVLVFCIDYSGWLEFMWDCERWWASDFNKPVMCDSGIEKIMGPGREQEAQRQILISLKVFPTPLPSSPVWTFKISHFKVYTSLHEVWEERWQSLLTLYRVAPHYS